MYYRNTFADSIGINVPWRTSGRNDVRVSLVAQLLRAPLAQHRSRTVGHNLCNSLRCSLPWPRGPKIAQEQTESRWDEARKWDLVARISSERRGNWKNRCGSGLAFLSRPIRRPSIVVQHPFQTVSSFGGTRRREIKTWKVQTKFVSFHRIDSARFRDCFARRC